MSTSEPAITLLSFFFSCWNICGDAKLPRTTFLEQNTRRANANVLLLPGRFEHYSKCQQIVTPKKKTHTHTTSLASTWTFKIPSQYTGTEFSSRSKISPPKKEVGRTFPTQVVTIFTAVGGTWGAVSLRSFRSGIIASALREGWMMALKNLAGGFSTHLKNII